MPDLTQDDVAFMGLGRSVPCWYRIALPAMRLGSDWVGMSGDPPNATVVTGNTFETPEPGAHKIIVMQQPQGPMALQMIRKYQRAGAIVLYEIDDYVHASRYLIKNGEPILNSTKARRGYEMCMQASDGLIASTQYIADRYSKYAKRTWVARNGIDLGRYEVSRPRRYAPTLGWAGGVGHDKALSEWWPSVLNVMNARADTRFVALGHQYDMFDDIPRNRIIRIPFNHLETFPASLMNIDVAIAPADSSDFWRGKSDLRFLECGAARLPGVYDERHYSIPEGCGLSTNGPEDAEEMILQLLDNPNQREDIGQNARLYVEEHRSDAVTVNDWVEVFDSIAKEVLT